MSRSRSRSASAAAVIGVVCLLAGCTGSEASGKTAVPPPDEPISDTTTPMPYSFTLSGGRQAGFSGEVPLRVMHVGRGSGSPMKLLSIGPDDKLRSGDEHFRVVMDLVGYEADGDYVIPLGSPRQLAQMDNPDPTTTNFSSVLVQVWGADPAGNAHTVYDERVEPCAVAVKKNGRAGTVTCPRLRDVNRSEIAVSMSWGS